MAFVKSERSVIAVLFSVLMLSGFAFALSVGANQINCTRTDYLVNASSPIGLNNITVSIVNDKCYYSGTSGTILTSVTMNQTQGSNISNANFSQMMQISGLGTTFNMTLEYLNLSTMWQLIQSNSLSIPLNTSSFSWQNGTTKQFRINYTAAAGLSSLKFNVSNTINFTPMVFDNTSKSISGYDGSNPAWGNISLHYNGSAMGLTGGPILFSNFSGGLFFNTTLVNSSVAPEGPAYNYSIAGACYWASVMNGSIFNTSNKSIAAGNVYCFQVSNGTNTVAYTVVKVMSVTETTSNASAVVFTKMSAVPVYVTASQDPYFDSLQHNLSIYVNGTSGQPVSGATIGLLNSTAGLQTNTTNSSGWAVFYNLPSENYTWYAYNLAQGVEAYNVSNLTGLFLNSTAQAISAVMSNYDDEVPTITYVAPVTAYVTTSTPVINVTFNSTGHGNPARLNVSTISVNLSSTSGYALFNSTNMNCTYGTNTTLTCNATSSSLTDGVTYTLNASVRDHAGNTNYSTTTFVPDANGPIMTMVGYTNGTWKRSVDFILFNASVSDTGSAVSSCNYSINGNYSATTLSGAYAWANFSFATLFEGGNQSINITCNDSNGNKRSNLSHIVGIDNTAPSLALVTPLNNSASKNGSTLTFNVTIAYTLAPISGNCSVTIGGTSAGSVPYNESAGWCYGNVTVPNLVPDGNRTINVTIYDNATNLGFNQSFATWLDNVVPAVTITSPSSGANVSGNVQINGSASDSSNATYRVYYRLGTYGPWYAYTGYIAFPITASNYTTFRTANFADGAYMINVSANDTAGNYNSATVAFNVNNSNLTASLSAPTPSFYRNNITVTGVAINGSGTGIAGWNLTAVNSTGGNTTFYNSTTANATFSYTWDISNLTLFPDGNYTLMLTVLNTVGGNATAVVYNVSIDRTAPTIASTSVDPATDGGISATYVVNTTIADGAKGVANASATIYNGSFSASCDLTDHGSNAWGCDGVLLPLAKNYLVNITAYDRLGNVNSSYEAGALVNVSSYTYILSSFGTSSSLLTAAGTVNASGYLYYAFTNGTTNNTPKAGVNVTFRGCSSAIVSTGANGYFSALITVPYTCQVNASLYRTNVTASATVTVTVSSSSGTTGTTATATPTPTLYYPPTTSTPTPVVATGGATPTPAPVASVTPVPGATATPAPTARPPTITPTPVVPPKVTPAGPDYGSWILGIIVLLLIGGLAWFLMSRV